MHTQAAILPMMAKKSSWFTPPGGNKAIAAYQPIGALSYATSKVNIANPGTYDAFEGIAPTWDAIRGWKFTGLASPNSQYLRTGVVPVLNQTWSMVILVKNVVPQADRRFMAGIANGAGAPFQIMAIGVKETTGEPIYATCTNHPNYTYGPLPITDGVYSIAGIYGYRDGVLDATTPVSTKTNALDIRIGGANNGLGAISSPFYGDIGAIAVFDYILSPAQNAWIAARMAVLPL